MTGILGLSAYYHDSAAALVVDGCMTARLQYRTGHDPDARSYRVPVDRNRVTRLEEPF